MFDDSSPSVLSLNATHASKLEEAGSGEAEELALEDAGAEDAAELASEDAGAEVAAELVPDDASAEDVVELEDDDGAGLGGGGGRGGGCGSGKGVAWNPAGGIVRTWPISNRYGVVRWFSSTTAYQGTPKWAPTDVALSPGCTT
jgi:hypothetical protein